MSDSDTCSESDRGFSQSPSSAFPYERCIAKTSDDRPGMKVEQHCRIVGSVARELLARLPRSVATIVPEHAATIAAVHDVGKVSPGFQKKIANEYVRALAPDLARLPNSGFRTDHCEVGAAAVRREFGSGPLAEIVAAHHGGVRERPARTDAGSIYGGPGWADERTRLIEGLVAEFGEMGEIPSSAPIQAALAGLVTVADWIGSDEKFFPPAGLPAHADLPARAADALDGCGWLVPQIISGLDFTDVFGFSPYPLQQAFLAAVTGPGLYILEAPMGSGKTEAALFAAYRLMSSGANRGLYFGLPTRLTSDKIHERVIPFLKHICADAGPPQLAHGTAWLRAYEHGGEGLAPGYSWFSPRKRSLLHPFGVGTIDQALLGVLRVKHYFVRMFGLAGKVVILDEIHSYDIYTGTLLEKLVRQLLSLGCTVIVLSATLTGERRGRLLADKKVTGDEDGYPMITTEREERVEYVPLAAPPGREYVVRVANGEDDAVAAAAVAKAQAGNCVLCIANTVGQAQQWYDAVSAGMAEGQFPLGLLHSKFPAFRREDLEREWLDRLGKRSEERPRGCVLVATQVVEQSVDIDADALITQLAPTDMLLQRLGRVWRHARQGRPCSEPEVTIVAGQPEVAQTKEALTEALGRQSCFVYQPYILWRSWRVWAGLSRLRLPDDIRDLIERTYRPPSEPEPALVFEMRTFMEGFAARLEKFAHAAEAGVKGLGVMRDDERATTRYSDLPTGDILLVRSIETDGRQARLNLLEHGASVAVHADRRDFPVTARLHRQLVAVPRYVLEKLGGLKTPDWLRQHFHGATPVWEWDEASGALTMGGEPTGFAYDPRRGLRRLGQTAARRSQRYEDYEDSDVFDKTRFDW